MGVANFDPRAITLTNLVEVIMAMLHIKFKSSSLNTLEKEVFQYLIYF